VVLTGGNPLEYHFPRHIPHKGCL